MSNGTLWHEASGVGDEARAQVQLDEEVALIETRTRVTQIPHAGTVPVSKKAEVMVTTPSVETARTYRKSKTENAS